MNRMNTYRIQNRIFNSQGEGNRIRGSPRNSWLNCVQADMKKDKIFYWKKKLNDRDGWKRSTEEAKAFLGLYGQEEEEKDASRKVKGLQELINDIWEDDEQNQSKYKFLVTS